MLAWSLLLPFLKRGLSAERLVRLMYHRAGRSTANADTARIIHLAAWAARIRPLPGRGNCLERSLLAYRYLGRAGAQPRLAMGVRRVGGHVDGHAWIIVGNSVVDNDLQYGLQPFATVVEFGSDGRPIRSLVGTDVGNALAGADWDQH